MWPIFLMIHLRRLYHLEVVWYDTCLIGSNQVCNVCKQVGALWRGPWWFIWASWQVAWWRTCANPPRERDGRHLMVRASDLPSITIFWDQKFQSHPLCSVYQRTSVYTVQCTVYTRCPLVYTVHCTHLCCHQGNLWTTVESLKYEKAVHQIGLGYFYRTQVNLGSDLWVRMSVRPSERLLRLNWCDSGWWGYQLNTNW